MDASPTPADRRARLWLLAGLILFFVIVNVQYVLKVVNSERENRSAFLRWAGQIQEMDDGVDIWKRHLYPNPPIMVMILYPMTKLPVMAGAVIWFAVKAGMAIASLWWILGMLDRSRRFPLWAQAVTVLLSLRPIQSDLVHGNINIFILFLVVGSLWLFTQGRDFLAGLVLGLSIACKVTPALFLPYFFYKRAWTTLAGAGVGMAAFLFLVPALFLGWQRNLDSLHSWYDAMVVPYTIRGEVVADHQNQSLPGFLNRMLVRAPSFRDFDEESDLYVPLEYHNIANLDMDVVKGLVKGCLLLFVGAVVWRCRTPITDRSHWRLVVEFGVIAMGMLLFSERTWKHHCVTMAIPFAAIMFLLTDPRLSRLFRGYLIFTLVASTLLMTATSTGLFDRHDRFGKLAQVYGAFVWATFLLLVCMFVALGRNTSEPRTQ